MGAGWRPVLELVTGGGPIGACVEVANLEAIRAKEAIGDLRRCHVVDIDVMDGRLLVITWDWGK